MNAEPYDTTAKIRPEWLDRVPVHRYKHFTLFYKPAKGGGYYECFLNSEIDRERNKRGLDKWDG